MELQLEVNESYVPDLKKEGHLFPGAMITPAIGDEEYWLFRVKLSEKQAIIGFPKFSTIGVGFQKEEDWNTNLPAGRDAKYIFDHISINKGDENISNEDCIRAIELIKEAAAKV